MHSDPHLQTECLFCFHPFTCSLCRLLHHQQTTLQRAMLNEIDPSGSPPPLPPFPAISSRVAFAALAPASKLSAGELALALAGSCKNMAGKLKGAECDRTALLQSIDMHRSENRRLLEVAPLSSHH